MATLPAEDVQPPLTWLLRLIGLACLLAGGVNLLASTLSLYLPGARIYAGRGWEFAILSVAASVGSAAELVGSLGLLQLQHWGRKALIVWAVYDVFLRCTLTGQTLYTFLHLAAAARTPNMSLYRGQMTAVTFNAIESSIFPLLVLTILLQRTVAETWSHRPRAFEIVPLANLATPSPPLDLPAPLSQDAPPMPDEEIKLRYLPEYRIAYFRHTGPLGPALKPLWEQLGNWAKERKLLGPETIMLGICHDNPMTTAPDKIRYDAAIVIEWAFPVDAGATRTDFPGGAYLLIPFVGDPATIGTAWTKAFDQALPANKKTFDPGRPPVERYHGDCFAGLPQGHFRCQLGIPVKP